MSETFTNASQATTNMSENAVNISGDDLISLLEVLRRDGFPIGVKEYISAQEILIACSNDAGTESMRLRNWLAPVLCTNPDEQRFFYQRFADWLVQRQLPSTEPRRKPTPRRTQLDKEIKKTRPWKWLVIAFGLMAALVVVPELPKWQPVWQEAPVIITSPTEPGTEKPLPTRPTPPTQPEPVKQKPVGPQLFISGRVNDLEGLGISGATVMVMQELKGHKKEITSIAFSPDGTRVVTASQDHTARIWDTYNGRELELLKHSDYVISAVFSPDGSRVVTVSADNTARIWMASNGRELVRLQHSNRINSASFSPDGLRVVTASYDNTARIWNASDGRELVSLSHAYTVYYAEFSPDGRRIVTASGDDSARIWEAFDGRELAKLLHDGSVSSARFSPDGKFVVTASDDYTARIWEAQDGQELAQFRHLRRVNSARFSPDGSHVVTASVDKTARIWDAQYGRELAYLPHQRSVISAAFSPDGKRVITASYDKTARIWDIEGNELARLAHDDTVYSVTFSPDGKLLATGSGANAKLLSWAESDASGNFNLASKLTNDTQLQISHPDYMTPPLHDIPKGFGTLTGEAQLAPRPAQWLDTFILNPQQTRIILALLPILAIIPWWLWRRKRRQLILERRSVRHVDAMAGVTIPEPQHNLYRDEFFVRARIEARRHQASGQGDLDADATVEQTVRQLGWFTPVYKARLRLPAYLALIDRNGFQDQQTRQIDEFLDRLEEGGVTVDRYYFDRDPRMCVTGERGNRTRRALRELASRYSQHRLLLFSDGSGLLNPVTGRPSPWTELFSAWHERALMTPVPVFHWASREVELARLGCTVLPATPAGLLAFVEQLGDSKNTNPQAPAPQVPTPQVPTQWSEPFPEIIAAHPARWLQRDEPHTQDIDTLVTQLKRYLGADSYRWLCALAVYPELDWYLTLYLGLHLTCKDGKPVLDETSLLSLLRLPWLRRGNIPDWLRLRLIEELNNDDENTVRGFLRELMRDQLEAPGSRFHLDIAQPSESIHKADWTRFFTDMLRTEPEDSPLQDLVFVNFLLGKPPQRLQVLAPRNWHRLVYERGLSALGLRERAGLLLAAVASAVLALSALPLIQFAEGIQAGDTPSQIIEKDWQPTNSPKQSKPEIRPKLEPATKIADPAAFPPDYNAVYRMEQNGMNIAKRKVTLSRQQDDTWLYDSQIQATGFSSLFIKSKITGQTILQKIQGKIKPQIYEFIDSESKRKHALSFDWNNKSVLSKVNKTRTTLNISDETIDIFSLHLRLMSDLKAGQKFLSYNIVNKGKIKNYRFKILGEEKIEIDIGSINTLKLKGSSKDNQYSMMIWLAPELHYLPVKIVNISSGEIDFLDLSAGLNMTLSSVTGAITNKESKPVEPVVQQPKLKDKFIEKGRFSIRKLSLNKQGAILEMPKGGSLSAALQINQNCPSCGGAINQIIVGLAGEARAQACIWNGGQTSNGWKKVKFKLTIPDAPGKYEIRTRYAQAYNCKDALGWWKVDRPQGPDEKSTIGIVFVNEVEPDTAEPVKTDNKQANIEQQNINTQDSELMNPNNISKLNDMWNEKVWKFYNENIEGRYPFNPQSKTSVSLDHFGQFFGEDGIMQQFIEKELSPYLDTSLSPWRYREIDKNGSIGFTKATLIQLQRASEIRKAFFMKGGKTPLVLFRLKPIKLDKRVSRFTLEIDDARISYSHGPTRISKLQWPGYQGEGRARYLFEEMNGKRTQYSATGQWAWLRILDKTKLRSLKSQNSFKVIFTEGDFSASYELRTTDFSFNRNLRKFQCPQNLINLDKQELDPPKPPTFFNVK